MLCALPANKSKSCIAYGTMPRMPLHLGPPPPPSLTHLCKAAPPPLQAASAAGIPLPSTTSMFWQVDGLPPPPHPEWAELAPVAAHLPHTFRRQPWTEDERAKLKEGVLQMVQVCVVGGKPLSVLGSPSPLWRILSLDGFCTQWGSCRASQITST